MYIVRPWFCFISVYGKVSNAKTDFKLLSTCRPNWNFDGSDRSPVQSLEISGNYGEDEDMDTYLSDAEKEAESSCQSNERRGENIRTNAVYAVSCKKKKVGFSNALIPLPCFNILVQILKMSKTFHSLLILQTVNKFLFHIFLFVVALLLPELDLLISDCICQIITYLFLSEKRWCCI